MDVAGFMQTVDGELAKVSLKRDAYDLIGTLLAELGGRLETYAVATEVERRGLLAGDAIGVAEVQADIAAGKITVGK